MTTVIGTLSTGPAEFMSSTSFSLYDTLFGVRLLCTLHDRMLTTLKEAIRVLKDNY